MNISAIVPAYNEQNTIERVLGDLLRISFLTEIIVIDDGSQDETQNKLRVYSENSKVKVLLNNENRGKGYSVARGIEHAKGELILILDADIINYTESDLILLMNPVLNNKFDFSIKMTDDRRTKFTSGVRAYWRRDLVSLIDEMKRTTRYGLEVLLNMRFANRNGTFITLSDYKHFQKFDKYPLHQAVWEYIKEGASILAQKVKQF